MVRINLTKRECQDVIAWCRSHECSNPDDKEEQRFEKSLFGVANKLRENI